MREVERVGVGEGVKGIERKGGSQSEEESSRALMLNTRSDNIRILGHSHWSQTMGNPGRRAMIIYTVDTPITVGISHYLSLT